MAPEGTTLYLNAFGILVEKVTSNLGVVQWNNYLFAGGEMIGAYFERPGSTNFTRYFHKDHLGSVVAVTDETGAAVEQDSYDAWGKRRFPNGASDPDDTITSLTTRGFTGQEYLQEVALIHLNGRVYDPQIGRFTSVDPMIEAPFAPQDLNRYSYVGNNPLAHTDPIGLCFLGCFWKPVFHAVGSVFNGIGSVFRSTPVLAPIFEIAAVAACPASAGATCAIEAAAGSSAFVAGVTSGKLGIAIKAGIIAGGTSAAFYGVDSLTTPEGGIQPFHIEHLENIVGHAAVGCAFAAASGDDCGPSALAGAITSFAGPYIDHKAFAFAVVANAVVGGGKFENGAITGAFGYLFNDNLHCALSHDCTPEQELAEARENGIQPFYGFEKFVIGAVVTPFRIAASFFDLAAEGVEFGTVLADGTVADADAAGAAPNLAHLGAKFGINADSEVGANLLQNLNTPVRDFISQNRLGSIKSVFPSEYLNGTVGQALQQGGSTVRKLLLDSRFAK